MDGSDRQKATVILGAVPHLIDLMSHLAVLAVFFQNGLESKVETNRYLIVIVACLKRLLLKKDFL